LDQSEGACPYCQQQTPIDLAKSLVDYFDGSYVLQFGAVAQITAALLIYFALQEMQDFNFWLIAPGMFISGSGAMYIFPSDGADQSTHGLIYPSEG